MVLQSATSRFLIQYMSDSRKKDRRIHICAYKAYTVARGDFMTIVLGLLMGIAVNLDNFLIGISLCLKHQKLTFPSNILISAVTAAAASAVTGFSDMLSHHTRIFGTVAGSLSLIVFGLYCLLKPGEDTEKYELLSFKQTLFVGLILAVNCIPPAFSAGIFKIPPLFMGLSAGCFSMLSLYISTAFGEYFYQKPWVKWLSPVSYALLVILGIIGFFF